MTNRNAFAGRNVEALFKNSVVDYPSVIEAIRNHFKIQGRFTTAIRSGIHGEKSDVKLSYYEYYVDCNIKAYKENSGFNQLTRTTAREFSRRFNCDENALSHIICRKAGDPSQALFNEKERLGWLSFFESNAKDIVKWCMSFKASREILVLYNRDTGIFNVYPMQKCLSKLDYTIKFTKGGIDIGHSISFQRKGGNGKTTPNVSKTDIKHPGNNVQLKLKIKRFISEMEDIKLAQYQV